MRRHLKAVLPCTGESQPHRADEAPGTRDFGAVAELPQQLGREGKAVLGEAVKPVVTTSLVTLFQL